MLPQSPKRRNSSNAILCGAGTAPPWDIIQRGKNKEYRGRFVVFDPSGQPVVRVGGRVLEWHGLPVDVYLFNPPRELRNHPHGSCLQLVRPDDRWFKIHFERPARTFDQARAYIEQLLAEAVIEQIAQPQAEEIIREAPAPAPTVPITPSTVTLRYERRHHWLWIARRIWPLRHIIGLLTSSVIATYLVLTNMTDLPALLLMLATFIALLLITFILVIPIWWDWYRRSIRLYSDGRLDYVHGYLNRHCMSVSTRFGAIRYHYQNELMLLLDCADVELPFDAGIIEAVPQFSVFWPFAQGRE